MTRKAHKKYLENLNPNPEWCTCIKLQFLYKKILHNVIVKINNMITIICDGINIAYIKISDCDGAGIKNIVKDYLNQEVKDG